MELNEYNSGLRCHSPSSSEMKWVYILWDLESCPISVDVYPEVLTLLLVDIMRWVGYDFDALIKAVVRNQNHLSKKFALSLEDNPFVDFVFTPPDSPKLMRSSNQ